MSMTPEKIRALADTLFNNPVDTHIEIITSWLEQNHVEPVVVGLSDEQVIELGAALNNAPLGNEFAFVIKDWLKTQIFEQPESNALGVVKTEVSAYKRAVDDYRTILEEQVIKLNVDKSELLDALADLFNEVMYLGFAEECGDSFQEASKLLCKFERVS